MGVIGLNRKPNDVSLSKSGLLLGPCLAWANKTSDWYDEVFVDGEDLSKRDLGTAFHKAIDRYESGEQWEIPEPMVRQMAHAMVYLEKELRPRCSSVESEEAVGIRWADGKSYVLAVKDRNYPNHADMQYGTADLLCKLTDRRLYIGDWKTGGTEGATEQLTSLACGFSKALGHTGDVVISCLQVNEDGVWPHESVLTQTQLQAHWDAMRFQWEDIGERNNVVPGIHCTTLYCPHLAYCDAITKVVVEQAGEAGPSIYGPLVKAEHLVRSNRMIDVPLSDESAGEAMALISAANRQIKYRTAKMKEYASKPGNSVRANGHVWEDRGAGYRWYKA